MGRHSIYKIPRIQKKNIFINHKTFAKLEIKCIFKILQPKKGPKPESQIQRKEKQLKKCQHNFHFNK